MIGRASAASNTARRRVREANCEGVDGNNFLSRTISALVVGRATVADDGTDRECVMSTRMRIIVANKRFFVHDDECARDSIRDRASPCGGVHVGADMQVDRDARDAPECLTWAKKAILLVVVDVSLRR